MKYNSGGALALAQSRAHDASLPMDVDSASPDLARRARILRSLRKARAMLQETRNKSAQLQDALERFKQHQSKIAIGSARK